MSIKYTYKANQRGKLVTVPDKEDVRVFSSPEKDGITPEFIHGPETVGTATGKTYSDGIYTWIEVLRVSIGLVLNVPQVTALYLIETDVTLTTNPAYDASKDTDAPNEDGSYKGTTIGTANDSKTSTDTSDVSEVPGPGRVPVTASNGKTVYVLVPASTTTTDTNAATTETTDKTKKYLTWGLYGVLGLGVVTLIVILVMSLSKPKPKVKP